jgi:hypothetical protein
MRGDRDPADEMNRRLVPVALALLLIVPAPAVVAPATEATEPAIGATPATEAATPAPGAAGARARAGPDGISRPTGASGAIESTSPAGVPDRDGTRRAGTGGSAGASSGVCAGRIVDPADGVTVVSVQGARFTNGSTKTPARLLGFGPRGELRWVYHAGRDHGVVWSYDVDPMENGHVFVTATTRNRSLGHGTTLLFELDPRTGERVWTEEVPFLDTHDADLLGDGRIAIANMRNYDEAAGENRDRVVIYDRHSDEIVWEWRFDERYPPRVGGEYEEDWTHLNDVDYVPGRGFLLSPRNFDQVILVNRTTGEIDLRLGADGDVSTLKKQHNPDYLESEAGRPTILVADSENDRVVEYERGPDGWNRTWRVGNRSTLDWPRDADRLPNGNTLIGDSRHNRVIEVTPEGEVVWEVYGPWLVYDVERFPGDGSRGPTAADVGSAGAFDLKRASPPSVDALERCDAAIDEFTAENVSDGGTGGAGTDRVAGDGETGSAAADRTAADDGESGAGGSAGDGSVSGVSAGPTGGSVAAALLALLAAGTGVRIARRR